MVPGNAAGAADWERRLLRQASLWWVSEDMAAVTAAAAASIPDDVTPADLTMPGEQAFGMAVLATPWLALDANDAEHTVHVDVVVWGPTVVEATPALSLSFYRYLDFGAGLDGVELRQAIESGGILDGRPEANPARSPGGPAAFGLTGGAWAYIGRSDWPYRRALSDTSDFAAIDADATRRASYVEDRRWFSAFSLLVNHRLSQLETVYAPRAVRRRGQRVGVDDREVSNVRLIRLRQPKRAAGDSDADVERRQVEWTHRWIVSGHTAWRRCGTQRKDRRLVYIAPFVKGPDDKPLVVTTDVRMWVR
jgi:hypothetical protein